MKKKIYNGPKIEVVDLLAMDATMQHVFGPASMAGDPQSSAPSRKVPALGNDSVQVF